MQFLSNVENKVSDILLQILHFSDEYNSNITICY